MYVHLDNQFNISVDDQLKRWYFKHHPTRECAEDILKILKSQNIDVPISLKGLLGSPSNQFLTRTVSPGTYCHFGIGVFIEKVVTAFPNTKDLILDVGVDGLPLFKSSQTCLWPILGHFINVANCPIFLIGCYLGDRKPSSLDIYLHDFITEMKVLLPCGYLFQGKQINISLRAFICDAPARAFMCGVVGHNSFNGCSKCTQHGVRINNVNTYCKTSGMLRTNIGFKNRCYEDYHKPIFRQNFSELEKLDLDMIKSFPLDPMHLLDLGVCKKILNCIIKKETVNFKISPTQIESISERLLLISPFFPCEFVRKPRSLIELPRWKAVEFRQFLLYSGIIVLKGLISEDLYYNFVLLSSAYKLLL